MIKVILLDIDGTLTNSKKEISPRTKEALLKAQEQGITLALCSGRTDNGLMRYAKELDMIHHNGLFVCFNGGKVMNCQTNEVLFNQTMNIQTIKAILNHLKQFDVQPVITNGKYMYVTDVFKNEIHVPETFNVLQYESRSNGYLLCEVDDLAEFVDFEVNKILTYGEPEYLKEHYLEMSEPFKDTLNSMFTAPFYFEYTDKGIDKAKAIQESFPFKPEEMIAFGDAQNDISMLSYAGIGVAMANATDETKAIADFITKSNDEDGIAYVLEKFL